MKYPECEKLNAVKDKSQVVGEFLEWLNEQGIELAKIHVHTKECYDEEEYNLDVEEDHMDKDGFPRYAEPLCGHLNDSLASHHEGIEKILARFFEIDLVKVENERQAMLDDLRKK